MAENQEMMEKARQADSGRLADEELENVAGGGCSSAKACSNCGYTVRYNEKSRGYRCQNCGHFEQA